MNMEGAKEKLQRLYFNSILIDIKKFKDMIPNKPGLEILVNMMIKAANNEFESEDEKKYIKSIGEHIYPYSYDSRVPYDKLCEALDLADRNNWRIRFVLDVEFFNKEATEEYLRQHPELPWYEKRKVGSCVTQCDGWSYHIEFDK